MPQDATISKLHDAAFTLTALVTTDERYEHMRGPLEMVVGGLIMKAIADIEPEQATAEGMQSLIAKYSPDAVAEWFKPKVKISNTSPQLEALTNELRGANEQLEKLRKQKAKGTNAALVNVDPQDLRNLPVPKVDQCYDGKNRRIKGAVKKGSKQKRELEPNDRDTIIRWWNTNQRLMDKTSEECAALVKDCGIGYNVTELLAPAQVAGCVSQISRKALWSTSRRENNITWNMKHGTYSVEPTYSQALIDSVVANYNAQRKDEDKRQKDHADIIQKRQGGSKTTPPASVALQAQAAPATEGDAIKYLASL